MTTLSLPCNESVRPMLEDEARERGGQVRMCACGWLFVSLKDRLQCNHCSPDCKTSGAELAKTQKIYWKKRWKERRGEENLWLISCKQEKK